jgi:general secretion pathway protein A
MEPFRFRDLCKPPFDMGCDPAYFYESRIHGEALARLLYVVADGGMGIGVLTGEIGSGKTMMLGVLRERVPRDRYRLISIPTAKFLFTDLLREFVLQLGGNATAATGAYDVARAFEQALEERVLARGCHLVLVLDEAQFLDPGCLEELKCLTNITRGGRPALTLLLAGQPELRDHLRALPQVYQRIGMVYHLNRLAADEVPAYVEHRLAVAGARSVLSFAAACSEPLFEFSGGCPRQINRVCKLAVDRALMLDRQVVDAALVQAIIQDIRQQFG